MMLFNFFMNLIYAIIAAVLVHDLAHTIVCKYYTGRFLTFYFKFGYLFDTIPIPRFVWYMPKVEYYKQENIALVGFDVEMLLLLVSFFIPTQTMFLELYRIVVIIHRLAYPYYCGEFNELKYLDD